MNNFMRTVEQIKNTGFTLSYPTKVPYVTQPFGANYVNFYALMGLKGHNGIDFRAFLYTPVYACCDGTVLNAYNGDPSNITKGRFVDFLTEPFDCEGETIKLYFVYYHLWHTDLRAGQKIKRGDLIGYADNTGTMTTGSHLHFGMYELVKRSDGEFVKYTEPDFGGALDPMSLFTIKEDIMTLKKKSDSPHYWYIANNKKYMIVDMPTYQALGSPQVEIDNNLDSYPDGGTFVVVERIIN